MSNLPTSMEQPMILNCNLELCLSPPSTAIVAVANSTSRQDHITRTEFPATDLTELQARAIILEATRQMEERRSTCGRNREEATLPVEELSMNIGPANPSTRIRSLQRFLQKRKLRIQTMSPYTH